jgi:hypothetical protein
VVAGPFQNLAGHYTFDYGGSLDRGKESVTLQRSIIISGMTYTAQFWLWKE